MQSVKNISFKSDSNLLKKVASPQEVKEENKQSNTVVTQELKQQPDTFENKTAGKKSYLKEYSGIAALAVSALGLPITYAVTKKTNTKAMNKLQGAIEDLSQKLSKLDVDEKIKTALEQSAKQQQGADKLVSKKSSLAAILLGIGSGLGISEFLKGNKDKLKEMGYTDDEINEAGRIASGITDNAKNALTQAGEAHRIASGIGATAESAKSIAERAERTASSMDGRVNELARIIDGVNITQTALDHARKLIENS